MQLKRQVRFIRFYPPCRVLAAPRVPGCSGDGWQIELPATFGESCQNNSHSLPDELPFITMQCWTRTCRRQLSAAWYGGFTVSEHTLNSHTHSYTRMETVLKFTFIFWLELLLRYVRTLSCWRCKSAPAAANWDLEQFFSVQSLFAGCHTLKRLSTPKHSGDAVQASAFTSRCQPAKWRKYGKSHDEYITNNEC